MFVSVRIGSERVQGRTRLGIVVVVLFLVVVSSNGQDSRNSHLPRLPEAALLMGYPPDNLMVTTLRTEIDIQSGGGDWYLTPSMSADGNLVASARVADSASAGPRVRPLLTVGTYSMIEKRWRDYPNLEMRGGSVAISSDGSKLAYVSRSTAEAPSHIQFLNLKTSAVSTGPESIKDADHITWSHDGRRIAFDKEVERLKDGKAIPPLRAIYVLEVETGAVSKIADGMSPSWSPSGEWIAFYDYQSGRDDLKGGWYAVNANRVSIVHPDGTGRRVLVTFNQSESLGVPLVWSPGSDTLLINRWRDVDRATMNVYILDLPTLKLTKKFTNTPPVFAWVMAE